MQIKQLRDWDTVKGFSQAVVQHLARTILQRFVAKSRPKNYVGKIFVDYLRDGCAPWEGYDNAAVSFSAAIKRLGFAVK